MPRVAIDRRKKSTSGGWGWKARAEVNRLTAGDFSQQPVEVCWLRRFLEESR
jgi:hypothetical protein